MPRDGRDDYDDGACLMKIVNSSGETIFEINTTTGDITTGATNLSQPGGPHTHDQADVDGLEAALAGKSDVDHTHEAGVSTPQFQVLVIANPITYTNAAAGGTEPAGQQSRVQADLRGAVNVVGQCLFSVIPHAASGKLHFQYSTDGGSNWNTLLDMGTGGYSANTLKITAATAVPTNAKVISCLIRVIVHGDGVVDPVCQKAMLMFQGA